MNRRNFFKKTIAGAAAIAVSDKLFADVSVSDNCPAIKAKEDCGHAGPIVPNGGNIVIHWEDSGILRI